ncbi:hypothetical protein ASZ87_00007 [Vibrio cholerae]|nr:hypothetical protein ASZ87_00007 [Vibrio cholerae]
MNALELERAQYLKRLMSDLDRSGRGQKGLLFKLQWITCVFQKASCIKS